MLLIFNYHAKSAHFVNKMSKYISQNIGGIIPML